MLEKLYSIYGEDSIKKLMESDEGIKKSYDDYISEKRRWIFISADYSQLEVRIMAELTGDEKLISIINGGLDIHTENAKAIFKTKNPTKEQRRVVKGTTFAIVYGGSAANLSYAFGWPYKKAEKFIAKFFETFPGLESYKNHQISTAYKHGYVSAWNGRRRNVELFKGNKDAKLWFSAIKKTNKEWEAFKRLKSKGLTYFNRLKKEQGVALNMPIQSLAGDITFKAMVEFRKLIRKAGLKDTSLVLTVHDSILIETTIKESERALKCLKFAMEKLSVPSNFKVKLVSNFSVGINYEDLIEFRDFNELVRFLGTKNLADKLIEEEKGIEKQSEMIKIDKESLMKVSKLKLKMEIDKLKSDKKIETVEDIRKFFGFQMI